MDVGAVAQQALATLRVDRTTVLVARALDRAQVEHVLLKGPSTAQWLYRADPLERGYVDTDVLVAQESLPSALEVLGALGLHQPLAGAAASEQDGHSIVLRPDEGSALSEVDVHFTLPGVSGHVAEATLRLLDAHSRDIVTVLDHDVRCLDVVARAAVVVLHAARNGLADARSTEDLRRCLAQLPRQSWDDVLQLCRSLDALPALAAGLELLPQGQALARALGIQGVTSVEMRLRRAGAPAMAFGLVRLGEVDGLQARLRILAREVWPTAAFLDYWAERERLPTAGAVGRRRQRAVYLMRGAVPALRAWWRARRRSSCP